MKTTARTIIDILLTIAFISFTALVLSIIGFLALLWFLQYAIIVMLEHEFAVGIAMHIGLIIITLIVLYKLIRRMIRG